MFRSNRSRLRPLWRACGSAAVLLAASVGVIAVSAPSNAASTPTAGGIYTLAAGASGKCIEVPADSTASGALLAQAACAAGATRQQWKVVASSGKFNLVNVNSGKCIDVPSGTATSGLQLQQWGCGAAQTNQLWTFTASTAAAGKYRIINAATAMCVSDKDGSTAGGNPIVQETCSDIARMQWSFNLVGSAPSHPWSDVADGFAAGTTGGAAGATVTVSTYADLLKYATSTSPYVIRIATAITVPTYGYEIPVTSNKTLIGVGTAGKIVHGGIFLGTGVHNVIIRNLTIGETEMADDDPDDKVYDYDGIQMDTADHVWIDHDLITHTNDGEIDSRKDTTYLTVSWSILSDHNKTFGIGWTDNVTARMTIHHNWIHDTNQRNPSVDNVAYAHLYNNYMQNVTSYGNLSRGNTKMVLENSYFENVNNPYYPDTTAAQLVQRGSILVNCTGKAQTNGSAFDPASFYSYTLDPASAVPGLVKAYAGPQSTIGV
jgi:pectate lyase